jgi:hypothetical protein
VKELVEFGRLMIEPGTLTWKDGTNHRTSTINLVIVSDAANMSMVEVASDLYTGSDHEKLCWEIGEGKRYETRKAGTTWWKISQPIKNNEIDEEEKWRMEWNNRKHKQRTSETSSPKEMVLLFKTFLDDVFGRKRWSSRAKRWWNRSSKKSVPFSQRRNEQHCNQVKNSSRLEIDSYVQSVRQNENAGNSLNRLVMLQLSGNR